MEFWDKEYNFVKLNLRGKPPKNWDLYPDKGKMYLAYKGTIKHIFKRDNSIKTKVFVGLYKNAGMFTSYEELYKFATNKKYPFKHAKAHQSIQRQINFLRKELSNLPVFIDTQNGARLRMSPFYHMEGKNPDE